MPATPHELFDILAESPSTPRRELITSRRPAPPSTPPRAISARFSGTSGFQTPGVQTPQRGPRPTPVRTPEARKRNVTTPPVGRMSSPQCRSNDLQAALQSGSLSLVSTALLCTHHCCADHCIHEAVKQQHLGALDFLLEQGAAELDEPCCGRRPLHIAVESSMRRGDLGYTMAERLLRHGAHPCACAGDARQRVDAPLHDAAKRGNAAMTALLLGYCADVSRTDGSGQTPLHAAAQHGSAFLRGDSGHTEVARLLLRHGASPLQLDATGRKAIDYVFDAQLQEVLMSGERQWTKRALILALNTHSRCPGVDCMQTPEIFAAIIDMFLP